MTRITTALRNDANLWRAKVDDGLSKDEQLSFDKWLAADRVHREALAEAEIFWGAAGRKNYYSLLKPVLENHLASSGTDRFAYIESAKPKKFLFHSGFTSKLVGASLTLAASVLLFVAVGGPGFFAPDLAPKSQVFVTAAGASKIITLEDHSRITLGAASSIDLGPAGGPRTVRLSKGTAFFDIASNRSHPFLVKTEIGEVLVTGTRFDVQLSADKVTIAVAEGSVHVSEPENDRGTEERGSIDLSANEAITLTRAEGLGKIYEMFPAEIGAWRTGRLIYVRKSLGAIVEDLNRYTDRPLSISDDVKDLELSGTYDVKDIGALLRSLEDALPVRIITEEDRRRIVAK